MPTLKVIATRTDEYEITFDESIINEEWMKIYSESFSNVTDLQDVAEALSFLILRFGGDDAFVEGFGYVKKLRSDGSEKRLFGSGLNVVKEEDYVPGIVVKLVSEDDEHEFDITEKEA